MNLANPKILLLALTVFTLSGCGGGAASGTETGVSNPNNSSSNSNNNTNSGTNTSATANVQLLTQNLGAGTVQLQGGPVLCTGLDQSCQNNLTLGKTVSLNASAAKGYVFRYWMGDCTGSSASCQITPTQNTQVQAVFGTSTDLCAGLVTDKLPHPMTAVNKPALGKTFTDPQFGTTIRRISDAGAANSYIVPAYSTIPAWNSDESYLILYHTGANPRFGGGLHLYDGKTYQHIKLLDIAPADIEQFYWDSKDPQILYFANQTDRRFYRYNVTTEVKTVLHDFALAPTFCNAADGLTGGTDPMFSSWDSRTFGLSCGSKLFSYNLQKDQVGRVIHLATGGAGGGSQNGPQVSASGQKIFLNQNDLTGSVRDLNLNVLIANLGINPAEHADLGMDQQQNDALLSAQFDGDFIGSLVKTNLKTGLSEVIIGEATGYPYTITGTHISAVAYRKPGWVAVSMVGNLAANGQLGQGVLESEIALVNTNIGESKVCRIAHHRSCGTSDSCGTTYWAEPHVVISPSGTRILFGSDWNGGNSVDSYVVELPSYVATP